jgi:hypothetical protein
MLTKQVIIAVLFIILTVNYTPMVFLNMQGESPPRL